MVLVNRESVGLLDDSWAVLGLYFLLGPSEEGPDSYRAYVGEVGRRTRVLRTTGWGRPQTLVSSSARHRSDVHTQGAAEDLRLPERGLARAFDDASVRDV